MAISSKIFRFIKHIRKDDEWQKMSEWQLAKDVECSDGENVETKIININNILGGDDTGEEGNIVSRISALEKAMGDQVTYTWDGSTATLSITTKK